MKNEKNYKPQKTLYFADSKVWSKAEKMAKSAGLSVSSLLSKLVKEAQ